MKYLAFDTNAYRALDDDNKQITELIRSALVVGVPIPVLAELYFGFENGNKKQENINKLARFMQSPRIELLQINAETARIWGEISTELEQAGGRIQQNDIWIAALCKQYGFTLLTADKGFQRIIGLDVISF